MCAEESSAGLKVCHCDGGQHKNGKRHNNTDLCQVPFWAVLCDDSVE